MTDPVSQKDVNLILSTEWIGKTLYTEQVLDSTNQYARDLFHQKSPEGTVVCAEQQIKGRGRWGREWYSPKGLGLWFSVILQPVFYDIAPQGTMWIGCLAVLSAVEQLFGISMKIRWPNDLYFQQRKCCGFLAEYMLSPDRSGTMVLGIGLNVNQTQGDFPEHIKNTAVSLKMITDEEINRSFLLAEILNRLEFIYQEAAREGMDWLFQKWIAYSDLLDQDVVVRISKSTVRGRVTGFDKNGELILENHNGHIQSFSDGEVLEVKYVTGH